MLLRSIGILFVTTVLCAASWAAAQTLQQRTLYTEADAALDAREWSDYDRFRQQLTDYPLAIYLDYRRLDSRLRHVKSGQASSFLSASAGTPLELRFKDRYLRRSGKDRRWQDFLSVAPSTPASIDLQCYYYRAQLASGDSEQAWSGARKLWIHGDSRPDACDPLFQAWQQTGTMDDDAVWKRQLLAFEARRQGLMKYAARQGSEALAPWSERLLTVYRYPRKLAGMNLPPQQAYSLDILAYGTQRMARVDPAKARRDWETMQGSHVFTTAQKRMVGDAIAWRTLFDRIDANLPWLDQYLVDRGDAKLVETRLRLAIRLSDWKGLLSLSGYLPEARSSATVWRYWRAHARHQIGPTAQAKAEFRLLAMDRDYYGFLAAEQLGLPYQLNNKPLSLPAKPLPIVSGEAVSRTGELLYHDLPRDARSEWLYLLSRAKDSERVALAGHASDQGWYRFAIDAAIEARQWDALGVRFPQPYAETFQDYGKRYGIPDTELVSIARRESAFFSHAQSGAGARGLMQLLPSTAKRTARSLGQYNLSADLYQVEANIALGGAYYRQLLDSHGDNRVLSLAAYNAGPHRVKSWLKDTGKTMDVYQWVETIPFRETRDYVQGVLAYNVVYDRLRNGSQSLFRDVELAMRY